MKKQPTYKIHTDNERVVVALSTYAGKTVKGVAKCSPEDKFDFDTGKNIAEARCNVIVAVKRLARAKRKVHEAYLAKKEADKFYEEMKAYLERSGQELTEANCKLDFILDEAGVE
jgi:coenzyme F420-reducing hydrogenase delta subunit